MGAEAVIESVTKSVADKNAGGDPVANLRSMITKQIDGAGQLTSEESANGWLSIFDAYLEIPEATRVSLQRGKDILGYEQVFSAFPPTDAWPALEAAIHAKGEDDLKKAALILIIEYLRGDDKSRLESVEDFMATYERLGGNEDYSRMYMQSFVSRIGNMITGEAGNIKGSVAGFEDILKLLEEEGLDAEGYSGSLTIPKLTGIPAEKAEALLLRAIRFKTYVSIQDEATKRMMAQVILAHPEEIADSAWELVETPAEIPLYELFVEKYGKDSAGWEMDRAGSVYAMSLITERRFDDAEAFVLRNLKERKSDAISVDYEFLKKWMKEGDEEEVLGFLSELLRKEPTIDAWDAYSDLASALGKSSEVSKLLAEAIAGSENPRTKGELRDKYRRMLLEADKVDESIAVLKSKISDFPDRKLSVEGVAEEYLRDTMDLVELGRLLNRPELVDEGFAAGEKAVEVIRKNSKSSRSSDLSGYVQALVRNGRGAKAEEVVADELASVSGFSRDRRNSRADTLTMLAWVYSEAGRSADVVTLLDKGTMWDAKDLDDLESKSFASKPLKLIAAEALFAEGRSAEAASLVRRILQAEPGEDAAYALLLEIDAPDTVGYLDELAAANRFQERPLIWKAKLQSDAGRLEEAEKTIQAAINIDPSDGEQGKGDRMRAYSVLGEIMEKSGNKEKADFLRGVVASIRLSEDADDWWSAGMTARAITRYEAALNQFADAYCIQSRLALRYSTTGDFKKAAEHYQRAFELMPESFGRVESHCFGCEGAFSVEMAQQIAEAVFEQLAEKIPDRAQVFYLLGYLREEQGREAEAAENYSRAVELDSEYINAWKHLEDVAGVAGLSEERQDEVRFKVFQLDPRGQNLSEVSDLKRLWDVALDADAGLPERLEGPIYSLPASEAIPEGSNYYYSSSRAEPRSQLAGNSEFSPVLELVKNVLGR